MKLKDAILKLQELDHQELKINGEPDLDLLDYYWLLVSLMETVEKGYRLEILEDNTGTYTNYKVQDVEVDDNKLNNIQLLVSDLSDPSKKETLSFDLKKVHDARIMGGYKYYVTTPQGKYRFLMFVKKDA